MTKASTYSNTQILLHWIIAVLIFAVWYTGDGMGRALNERIKSGTTGFDGNTLHVWLGGIVFVLILVRICVRWIHGAPGPLSGSSEKMEMLAKWGHRVLYLLMFVVPGLGALAWYGHVRAVGEAHETLANALMIIALGHAAIAIWHQFVKHDGALTRMRPGPRQ